jgi:hypothetical protein
MNECILASSVAPLLPCFYDKFVICRAIRPSRPFIHPFVAGVSKFRFNEQRRICHGPMRAVQRGTDRTSQGKKRREKRSTFPDSLSPPSPHCVCQSQRWLVLCVSFPFSLYFPLPPSLSPCFCFPLSPTKSRSCLLPPLPPA